MKQKFKFFLILNGTATDDPETFQKSLTTCYENGIKPLEYYNKVLRDTEHNDAIVQEVILLKCQERWNGAAKRFFRKTRFEFVKKEYGLPVYG